jgi:putative glutathione S-transferase
MSESARDVSLQSDLKQLKREADGSFSRPPSTFRDTIQEGGKHEPEKGICQSHSTLVSP